MFHLAFLYLPPPPSRPEICEGILSETVLVKLYLSHWGHHTQTLEEPGDIEDIHLDTEVIDDIDYIDIEDIERKIQNNCHKRIQWNNDGNPVEVI